MKINVEKIANKEFNNKGFTIVELLLYMGLLSILLFVMTDLFVTVLDLKLETETNSSIEQDARFIMTRLTQDIRNAQTINIPDTLGTTTQSLSISKESITYVYALNTNNLQLNDGSSTYLLNSSESEIENISFKKLGNNGGKQTVQINFTIKSKTRRTQGVDTKTYQTTIGTR